MEMNYDATEQHEIEEELHYEILPGTEIMRDVGVHHFVKGKKNVLVPQPSQDKHDPLNWSVAWKASAITVAMCVSFAMAFGPLALAPMFPAYMEKYDRSLSDVVQFTGVCILVLGFSNFFWVPISTSFGRRPVYIFSVIVCLVSMIWRAVAKTYGSFMGACILNGFGAGPGETIAPAVIADIFFLHDRGKWNTLYWVCYMGALMVGPIVAGPMTDHSGLASFWWLNLAIMILCLIMVIFMFPETKWHRMHPSEFHVHARPHSDIEQPTIMSEKNGPESDNQVEQKEQTASSTNSNHVDIDTNEPIPEHETDPWLGRGGPSKAQFRIFTPNANFMKSIIMDVWIPWKLFAFPIVEYAAFVASWSASCFLAANLTQSQAFAAPPYNMTSQNVGFTNFAIVVGSMIGLVTAGPLSDWIAAYYTKKNNGIREPEFRLLSVIPYMICQIVGSAIVSVGYDHQWRWEIIVCVGYTLLGVQVAGLPSIASTYAVDSYKPVAGSLFVAITVNKNLWGYGFSKFITPWSESSGYVDPIMTNAALGFLWTLFFIPLFFWGKKCRRLSRNSSVHSM